MSGSSVIYPVAADVLLGGESIPWNEISVDMNVYALTSAITVKGPISTGSPATPRLCARTIPAR